MNEKKRRISSNIPFLSFTQTRNAMNRTNAQSPTFRCACVRTTQSSCAQPCALLLCSSFVFPPCPASLVLPTFSSFSCYFSPQNTTTMSDDTAHLTFARKLASNGTPFILTKKKFIPSCIYFFLIKN